MRHRLKGRKLGRTTAHRQAMARNIVTSLFVYGRVVTTLTRAKEFRGLAERMVTLGKRASGAEGAAKLPYVRRILRTVQDPKVARKIVEDVARRFTDRNGGYTRVVALGGSRWDGEGHGRFAATRLGDNGQRAIWELSDVRDHEQELYLAGRGKGARDAREAQALQKKKKAEGKAK